MVKNHWHGEHTWATQQLSSEEQMVGGGLPTVTISECLDAEAAAGLRYGFSLEGQNRGQRVASPQFSSQGMYSLMKSKTLQEKIILI